MKIIFHSNAPWNNSGYGKQAALFIPRIASLGHEIVISSPYSFGGSVLDWNGFQVLPCVRDSAGNDVLLAHYDYHKADLIITLADPFGLQKIARELSQVNLACWFPVDTNPVGEGDVFFLRESQCVPIAMSRFGQVMLRNEGTDPLYAPHGVDTEIYKPGSKRDFRDTLADIDDDVFIIGICAMNRDPLRKGLTEQMEAFARFNLRHPDSLLAMHTVPNANPGLNLKGMAARLGIGPLVTFPEQYLYDMGAISEENMAQWYNGIDVLSLCSYGEGFGLPLIEAQACGTPVITTDGSAMSELCGAGWAVSGSPFLTHGHGSFWTRPDVGDIDQAYEFAYQAWKDGTLPKKEAREFAMLYDADNVFEQHWIPVLEELEHLIMDEAA